MQPGPEDETMVGDDIYPEAQFFIWECIKNARVFVVSGEKYLDFYHSADVYTAEDIAGFQWSAELFGRNNTDDRFLIYIDKIAEAAQRVPFPDPEKWPFDAMFFSFGSRLHLSPSQMFERVGPKTHPHLVGGDGQLLGWLICKFPSGPVMIEFLSGIDDRNGAPQECVIAAVAYTPAEGWKHPIDLNPWIVNLVMNYVIGFQKFVEEKKPSSTMRWNHNRAVKRGLVQSPVPRPYYVIKLESKLKERPQHTTSNGGRAFEYNHRWEVRGHERVRYQRGPLPMDHKLRRKLLDRGYQVYDVAEPVGEDVVRMLKRGLPAKRADEWFALKTSWVKNHTKGPENTPIIPAMRVS